MSFLVELGKKTELDLQILRSILTTGNITEYLVNFTTQKVFVKTFAVKMSLLCRFLVNGSSSSLHCQKRKRMSLTF